VAEATAAVAAATFISLVVMDAGNAGGAAVFLVLGAAVAMALGSRDTLEASERESSIGTEVGRRRGGAK
jgi:hypothetical protein